MLVTTSKSYINIIISRRWLHAERMFGTAAVISPHQVGPRVPSVHVPTRLVGQRPRRDQTLLHCPGGTGLAGITQ